MKDKTGKKQKWGPRSIKKVKLKSAKNAGEEGLEVPYKTQGTEAQSIIASLT